MKNYLKRMRKREDRLKKELTKVEDARTAYESSGSTRTMKDANTYTKKKKKKKDKNLEKGVSKKKAKLDEMLLGVAGRDDKDFKAYKGDALDWTMKM